MKTNELIDELSRDLKPVRPMDSSVFVSLWILAASLVGIGAAFNSFRDDLPRAFMSGVLFFYGIPLVIATVFIVRALRVLSVPSRNDFRRWSLYAVIALVAVTSFLLFDALAHGVFKEQFPNGAGCSHLVLWLSVAPLFVWMMALRKAATTRPTLTGALVGFGCACFAAVAAQLCCPTDHAWHILGWHIAVPFLVTIVLGAVIGRFALRW